MHFHGQLLLFINKAHGYYAGMPFIGNAARRPRVELVLAGARATTSHWMQVGAESNWQESFLIHVNDCDGSELLYLNVYFELEGIEHQMATFYIELATLLSHTGVQWYQIRSVLNVHDHHSIRGEVNVEARWYVDETKVPDSLRQSVRAVVSTTDPVTAISKFPNHSTSSGSGGMKQSKSTPSIASLTIENGQQLADFHSRLQRANPHLDQRHFGLFPSPSGSALSTVAEGAATLSVASQSVSLSQPSSPSPPSPSPSSSLQSLTSLSLPSSTIPPSPFVYSGPLYGRIHLDTQFFDDHNFLEHHAGLAQVIEVFVYESRSAILGIQFVWSIQGMRIAGNKHKHPSVHGTPSVLVVEPTDYIMSIGIKRNEVGITALTLVTNKQRRSFGAPSPSFDELGDDCVAQCPADSRVVCATGGFNSAHGLNNIGVYYQQIASTGSTSSVSGSSTSSGSGGSVSVSVRSLGTLSKQSTSKKIGL